MEIGEIVIAKAGKEKNQVFVVVDVKENFAYIADGKRVKKENPKKKSAKHIQKASTKKFPIKELEINDLKVNASIRNFLKNI